MHHIHCATVFEWRTHQTWTDCPIVSSIWESLLCLDQNIGHLHAAGMRNLHILHILHYLLNVQIGSRFCLSFFVISTATSVLFVILDFFSFHLNCHSVSTICFCCTPHLNYSWFCNHLGLEFWTLFVFWSVCHIHYLFLVTYIGVMACVPKFVTGFMKNIMKLEENSTVANNLKSNPQGQESYPNESSDTFFVKGQEVLNLLFQFQLRV